VKPFPQERDRVPGVRLFAVLVWTLAVGVVAVGVSTLILHTRSADLGEAPAPFASVAPRTIGSIEQTSIDRTSAGVALRATQRRELDRFGWVDRDAGVAQIPIDRAMDVVVREGVR